MTSHEADQLGTFLNGYDLPQQGASPPLLALANSVQQQVNKALNPPGDSPSTMRSLCQHLFDLSAVVGPPSTIATTLTVGIFIGIHYMISQQDSKTVNQEVAELEAWFRKSVETTGENNNG